MPFPKGDLRRSWMVLGAIDALDHASARQISKTLNLPVSSVQAQLAKLSAGEIPGLVIIQENGVYRIDEWGTLLKPAGLRAFFKANAVQ